MFPTVKVLYDCLGFVCSTSKYSEDTWSISPDNHFILIFSKIRFIKYSISFKDTVDRISSFFFLDNGSPS